MPASDPMEILLVHDQWATRQILQACIPLSRDQYTQRFEIGPGSLAATTTHILGAMRGWEDVLAQREQRPRIETDGIDRTAADLLKLLDTVAPEFAAAVRAHPLDEIVSRERGGKTYSFTRGGVVAHVTTHGMHHRAQCLNMLRHLGVSPLPHSSVLEWMLHAEAAH